MTLREKHVSANDVRVPTPAAGDVLVIDRYSKSKPKAVVLNPDDYASLRETAALLDEAATLTGQFSEGALRARELEDRPRDDQLVEDSAAIADILGL